MIENAEGKAWMAIQERLNLWTETDIMLPDVKFKGDPKKAFLIMQDIGTDYSGVLPVGNNCGEPLNGEIMVSVMWPVGKEYTWSRHKGLAGRWCDFISRSFPLFYSDVRVNLRSRARITGGPRLDQSWNRLETQCSYQYWG